jgi:UPF0755 protein
MLLYRGPMARKRISSRFFLLTALLSTVPLLTGWWTLKREGPLGQETAFLVKRGANLDQLSKDLEHQGIIRSAKLFRLWARARNIRLIRGEYLVQRGVSLSEITDKLRRADVHFTSVVITPSLNAWLLQRRLQAFVPEDAFWALWRNRRLAEIAGFPEAETLEGLIAPATYRFHHAMEPEEVMLTMVETFRTQVWPTLGGGTLPSYETLILASLVEKETRLPSERPMVAGVFERRLKLGMRLQCDPTTLYARWESGDLRFSAPMKGDLERRSRFNTYLVSGLPPTPIAVPSRESIEAAKAPHSGSDLYFVATGHGDHNFASTLNEHNRNVSLYRREIVNQRRIK